MAVAAENGIDTRSRILREAEHLFMAHGFATVSMNRICEACKLTKPGVYYHFRDKEDLYVQVVLGVMGRAHGMLEAAAHADLDLSHRVEAAVRALVLIASQNMDQVRRDMVEHVQGEARHTLERSFFIDMAGPIVDMMITAYERGELRPDMRPDHAAKALLALTSSFTDQSGGWAIPPIEVPAVVTRILLEGFASR